MFNNQRGPHRNARGVHNRDRLNQGVNQGSQSYAFGTLIKFLSSWRFNIFLLVLNFMMITAYSLILYHQNMRE